MSQTVRIGINGLGRIGRTILREFAKRKAEGKYSNLEIVAANNPGDLSHLCRLLKYDSLHGKFQGEVKVEDDHLIAGDFKIKMYQSYDPKEINWSENKVDIVVDATGVFKDKAGLGQHINGTVKKVIMCAPGKDLDGTFVVGINHDEYDTNKHQIISNASCTTNCLAPVAKALHEAFGIEHGLMTTVHSYTSDQMLLDGNHSDPRRARAAAMSMIPTTTGAAKAVGLVLPELKGKLDGFAIRVPTPDVSLVDLTVKLSKKDSKEEVTFETCNANEKVYGTWRNVRETIEEDALP
ncbi:MAG: type I glyceraldehyde-3-phosphate dehydrogenase [Bacteriovoracaceae bacterium]|nr:type I glyceraldehyde-3-phosphate dehydrogenase [Bacteriovoracaceae bacterium]